MSMLLYALACFAKVFLAVFQAKNVQYSKYASMFVTSLLLTGADIFYIRLSVSGHIVAAVMVGSFANASAVVSAVYFFNRLRKPAQDLQDQSQSET